MKKPKQFMAVNFSRNLKSIMDHLGMSQSELADKSGVTRAAISQIINNKREPSLVTICRILNVIPISFEKLMKDPRTNKPEER